jgi:lysophospholipase L1-like esterase
LTHRRGRRATAASAALALALSLAVLGCGSGGPSPAPFAMPSGFTLPATAAANPQFGSGGLIVFDGDSLTAGVGAGPGEDYPSDVMRQLPEELDGVNIAVPGQTWSDMLADAEAQVDPLQSNTRPVNALVVWAGTNDLRRTRTAGRVWSDLQSYCRDRRDHGWSVVLLTVLPCLPRKPQSRFEEERQQLNAIIRARWREVADGLADVAADPRIGDPAGPDAQVFSTDGTHHNAAGNVVIAEVVTATLRPLVGAESSGR